MRERVKPLVSRIAADMPGYTVHDITHLDALWETASLVAPNELTLNPPEAFVFGGAVLLHDAAMTLAAYPDGLGDLKRTTLWADMERLYKDRADLSDFETTVKVEVVRRLHAEKAQELAVQHWARSAKGDERIYLIDQIDLREYYGRNIGLLAHSHWWPIGRVERELSRILNPRPPHTRHSVDLLKIAVLIRVADALHLDHRRAPFFHRVLEKPSGVAALHWIFQEKLGFPRLDDDAVIFTSGKAFEASDADAWWLCYIPCVWLIVSFATEIKFYAQVVEAVWLLAGSRVSATRIKWRGTFLCLAGDQSKPE
jgi:hypothetical protein